MPRTATLRELVNSVYEVLQENLDGIYEARPCGDERVTVETFLADEDHYPDADNDPGINYISGWLQGVADALGMDRLDVIKAHVHEPEEREEKEER